MIIENSNILLNSEHEKTRTVQTVSSHESFTDTLSSLQSTGSSLFANLFADTQEQSSKYTAGLERFLGRATDTSNPVDEAAARTQTSTALFNSLLEALTGKKTYTADNTDEVISAAKNSTSTAGTGSALAVNTANAIPISDLRPVRTITMNVKMTETVEEYECTKFNACGSVQTADGETIDLDLNLEMSRSYSSTSSYESTMEVEFKDPLVINFDGAAADLTEDTYEFDIDADGEMDIINFLNENSSLLALDKNEDGIINDGSELFGALSGDGFADLAAYDEDQNGWIDEADSVYDDLLLWSKVDGEDQYSTLAEAGLGAIYLNAIDTSFDLTNEDNEVRGQVKQSGIYLTENGQAGTVQQIDLAV